MRVISQIMPNANAEYPKETYCNCQKVKIPGPQTCGSGKFSVLDPQTCRILDIFFWLKLPLLVSHNDGVAGLALGGVRHKEQASVTFKVGGMIHWDGSLGS